MTKFIFDSDLVRSCIQKRGLSYRAIEQVSGGVITVAQLKYGMTTKNHCYSLIDAEARLLAEILDVPIDNLLQADSCFGSELPRVAAMLTRNLYSRHQQRIAVHYLKLFRIAREAKAYQNLMKQAEFLLGIFLVDTNDRPDMNDRIVRSTAFLLKECLVNSNSYSPLLRMDAPFQAALEARLSKLPEHYTNEHSLLLFAYALVLFHSIFFGELLFSAVQFCPSNYSREAEEYTEIAVSIEKLCAIVLDFVLTGSNAKLTDDSSFQAMGYAEELTNNTILLLTAAGMVVKHQESEYIANEYICRPELFAIVQRIENMLAKFGLSRIPASGISDSITSNFFQAYNALRIARATERAIEREGKGTVDMYIKYRLLCDMSHQ